MIDMRSNYASRSHAYFAKPGILAKMGLWLVGIMLIWSAFALTARPVAAQQGFQLFVPSIATDGADFGGSDGGEPIVECILNENEQGIADLMVADEGQNRVNPVCDATLSQVARARARDMATRGYFSHTTPEGDGPNLLVRREGYPLPDWYGDEQGSNNIESIGAGYATPQEAWTGWLNSPQHRTHVLATQQFYADQRAYGVGYYFNPDSVYKHYWVFLSAPIAE